MDTKQVNNFKYEQFDEGMNDIEAPTINYR